MVNTCRVIPETCRNDRTASRLRRKKSLRSVRRRHNAAMMLADVRYSPIARLAEKYQIDIHVTEEKCRELVRLTAKYGVRGIYSELQSLINEAIFEDCKVTAITIS